MIRTSLQWIARGSCRHPEAMTLKGGSLCAVEFPAMIGVIRHPQAGTFLFDTGYDEAFASATAPFPERLYRWATPVRLPETDAWESWSRRHGIAADEISGVILSHFHGDHVAGLRRFGGVPVHCSRIGLARVRSGGRLRRATQGLLAALVPGDVEARAHYFEDAAETPLPSAFAPFTHGRDLIGDGSLFAVKLPGHCPGHWGLALRTQEDRFVLLAGDAVWSGQAIDRCLPPPRLTTALLGDTRAYRATLATLHAARIANPDLAILPSHCAASARAFAGDDAV